MKPQKGTRGYNVWSHEEETALRAGVAKHGLGAWEIIRKDPAFSVLSQRTGVQLKDKFRNLVKFRHITQEESRQLKPKGSGPWSRKYNASGSGGRERSLTRTPSASALPIDEGLQAVSAAEGMLQQGVDTERTRSRSPGPDSGSTEDEGDASGRGRGSKRRRSAENRRFGIYDVRRYGANGEGGIEEIVGMDDGMGFGGPGRSRGSRRSGGRRRRGRSEEYETASDETTEDDEVDSRDIEGGHGGEGDEGDEPRSQRRSARAAARRAVQAAAQIQAQLDDPRGHRFGGVDMPYIVACSCGVNWDDGKQMVQCEGCRAWSHVSCAQKQAANNRALQLDLDNFWCPACQYTRALTAGSDPTVVAALQPLALGGGLGLPPLTGSGGFTAPATASSLLNGSMGSGLLGSFAAGISELGAILGKAVGDGAAGASAEAGAGDREGKDKVDEAGQLLLGLANGHHGGALGGSGSPALLRTAPGENGADAAGAEGLRKQARTISTTGPGGLPPSINEAQIDSLSHFLATNRTNSALGHRSSSPKPGTKGLPGAVGGSTSGQRSRMERMASGGLAGVTAPRARHLTASDSHPNLEHLLAATAATTTAADAHAAAALAATRLGSLSSDGRMSPNSLALLKRAGSSGGGAAPGAHAGAAAGDAGAAAAGTSAAGGLVGAASVLSMLGRPPSRGPLLPDVPGVQLFGDSDDEHHHASQLAALEAQIRSDSLLQILGANSRAPTPSQLFIDSLLRGSTPDINIAPLLNGALSGPHGPHAPQGPPGAGGAGHVSASNLASAGSALSAAVSAAATAAAAQAANIMHALVAGAAASTALQQAGLDNGANKSQEEKDKQLAAAAAAAELLRITSGSAASGLAGSAAADLLRSATPDPWGLLRGTTPTPDGLGIPGLLPPPNTAELAAAHAQWLLARSTPPLAQIAELAAITAQGNNTNANSVQAPSLPPPAPLVGTGTAAASEAPASAAPPQAQGEGDGSKEAAVKPEDAAGDAPQGVSLAAAAEAPGGPDANVKQEQPPEPAPQEAAAPQPPADRAAAAPPAAAPAAAVANGSAHPTANGTAQQQPSEPAAPAAPAAIPEHERAAAAAKAFAEAAAAAAAAAAVGLGAAGAGGMTAAAVAAAAAEMVDRKASLGLLGLAATSGGSSAAEDGHFNVEDMLRSSTPALR